MATEGTHDLLVDPLVHACVTAARMGVTYREPVTSLRIKWSRSALERVVEWLKAGARLDELAKLIIADPILLGHPLVFRQFAHLRRLRRQADEDHLHEGSSGIAEQINPQGSQQDATNALQLLFEALGRGLFPGAKISVRFPLKDGRPRIYPEWTAAELLVEFNGYYGEINCSAQLSPAVFRVRGPGAVAEVSKLVKLLDQLHASSWRSDASETYLVPDEPELDPSGNVNLRRIGIRHRRTALPKGVAKRIATGAILKRKVSPRLLAYGLLAHYERKTLHQIRGVIERAEADYDDLVKEREQP